jgi:hypothetical protein
VLEIRVNDWYILLMMMIPVHTSIYWYILTRKVCTCSYQYILPVQSNSMYRYMQGHTSTYLFIPVHTGTYRYTGIQVHTNTYKYIPVHT